MRRLEGQARIRRQGSTDRAKKAHASRYIVDSAEPAWATVIVLDCERFLYEEKVDAFSIEIQKEGHVLILVKVGAEGGRDREFGRQRSELVWAKQPPFNGPPCQSTFESRRWTLSTNR